MRKHNRKRGQLLIFTAEVHRCLAIAVQGCRIGPSPQQFLHDPHILGYHSQMKRCLPQIVENVRAPVGALQKLDEFADDVQLPLHHSDVQSCVSIFILAGDQIACQWVFGVVRQRMKVLWNRVQVIHLVVRNKIRDGNRCCLLSPPRSC